MPDPWDVDKKTPAEAVDEDDKAERKRKRRREYMREYRARKKEEA